MKSLKWISLLLVILALAACDSGIAPEKSLTDSSSSSQMKGLEKVLPPGNGVQRVVDGRPDTECGTIDYCTGDYTSMPYFDSSTNVVKSGTWITLGWGLSTCWENEVTDEEANQHARDFAANSGFSVSFDGDLIENPGDYFRPVIQLDASACPPGLTYRTALRWRYFVQPHAPGTYPVDLNWFGNSYSRDVEWTRGKSN